jgi:oxalate decarboxylase/phosphoglucose isomerase-like protein (cupin superfamily)
VKTKGHYHPENSAGIGYPELYEVIEGVAHVLLQKKTLDHIALAKATNSDLVIIPPGYGHVTINPSRAETLVMANLVSTAFNSALHVSFRMPALLEIGSMAGLPLLVVIAIGSLSSLWPAYRSSTMNPYDAIRNEGQ